jgi:peptidoglycan glycosyltransferase
MAGSEAATPRLEGLAPFEPEAILVGALERGDPAAAERLAALLLRARHPLGPLYAAVLAYDRGAFVEARAARARSVMPLSARGPGARLEEVRAARSSGARAFLWDRGGRLVATVADDRRLRPAAGAAGVLDAALGRLAAGLEELPADAAVRLTLDLELSRAARDALGERHGSIVLLDARTGALLAAVADPRTLAREPMAPFEEALEPASIAKVLTSAAAYRAGIDADAEIRRMTCTGVERYGGKPLWCAFPAGPLEGLDHALAVSCNVAFGSLAQSVGNERLLAEYRLWGFDAGPGTMLGAAGHVRPPAGARGLADLGVGLEQATITPLHAASLAAVVAEGRQAPLHLVAARTSLLALRDEPRPGATARVVLAADVAARLREAMRAVALRGTGSGLAPEGFPVAMKTGTAATPGHGYHVNYVGIAPLPEAGVAFSVRVTGERSSPAVTTAAREVTRRLLASLASRGASLTSRGPSRSPSPPPAPSR